MFWDGWVRGFGRGGRVWGRPKKVNAGRKWVETEDEGNSSFEKLRAVLAVLLVVAVSQNTPSEIQVHAKVPNTRFLDLQNIFRPPIRYAHPSLGAYRTPDQPPEVATTCKGSELTAGPLRGKGLGIIVEGHCKDTFVGRAARFR